MNINDLITFYKLSQNPQQILKNYPQLNNILALYNGDAKKAFYSMCEERKIDPNSILDKFK